MAASDVDICNLALIRCGQKKTLYQLADGTVEGTICQNIFPLLRDELLASFPWPFATRRATLTKIGEKDSSATWNPALEEKVGNVLADELEVKGAHILLAPTVNIHRTPVAGRNFECYSEDPLSGMIASAYIKGIQAKGKGACIKHYVANYQEYERFSMSSELDERTLRARDLPGAVPHCHSKFESMVGHVLLQPFQRDLCL